MGDDFSEDHRARRTFLFPRARNRRHSRLLTGPAELDAGAEDEMPKFAQFEFGGPVDAPSAPIRERRSRRFEDGHAAHRTTLELTTSLHSVDDALHYPGGDIDLGPAVGKVQRVCYIKEDARFAFRHP